MKTLPHLPAGLLATCAAFLVLGLAVSDAATATQTITLQPGWNAVQLEVQPPDPAPAAVFAGVPIEMVWSYFPTRTSLEYIQNPSDGLWNVPGWNVFLPPSHADAAALTNLFAIQAHQACLVKIRGSAPVTLTVTGAPAYREIRWQPDGFTLTGLALDPATTVRSGDFFFNSPSHKTQPRFRLNPSGTWAAMNDNTALRAGEAYWVFTKGASDFSAPLAVEFGGGGGIDFGPTLESQRVVLRNRSASAVEVHLANPGGFPLVISSLNATTGATTWTPLTTLTRSVPPGGRVSLTLGVRRAALPADGGAVLTISAQGIRRLLPVAAQNPTLGAGLAALAAKGVGAPATATTGNPNAGLWVGAVALNAVSESHSATPAAVTNTPATFTMRLLLHVDDAGATRLLKEIILMKQPGGTESAPAALVLLSNPALIPQFAPPAQRDGAPLAYRTSTIGFDFAGHELPLTGAFGSTLSGMVAIPRHLPTHPFKHRYHPDHDDLDAQFAPPAPSLPSEAQEVWTIARDVTLTFTAPPNDNSPEAGYSERVGTYREVVSGMHKNDLVTAGVFRLRRLNTLGELNPTPAAP